MIGCTLGWLYSFAWRQVALTVACFSFISCATTEQITDTELIGILIEYLVFDKEGQAETAQEKCFQAGWEVDIEQAFINDEPVFVLQLPDYMSGEEFINMVYDENGEVKHFFPKSYIGRVQEFIISFD